MLPSTCRILYVAPVWTERSTCHLYPGSKIDFFLRVQKLNMFNFWTHVENSTCRFLHVESSACRQRHEVV